MIDNALRGGVINTRQFSQIVCRGTIDVDRALLFDTLNHSLRNRFGVARSCGSGAGCLLADLIRTAVVRGAAREREESQRNQDEKPHTR